MAIVYDTSRFPVEGSFFPPVSQLPNKIFVRFSLSNPISRVRFWVCRKPLCEVATAQQACADKAFTPVPVQ